MHLKKKMVSLEFQKLISNSPKNSSYFMRNNTSDYYSKNKTQRISDKNILNYTKRNKHNNSGVEFDNIINDNNNYYIGNDNCNNFQGFVNNKNILINNNIKQKNKNLSIFNNFNKIIFYKKEKTNYLNSFKNSLILGKKIKILNSGKNSLIRNNPKYKTSIIYNITKENSNSFLNTNF